MDNLQPRTKEGKFLHREPNACPFCGLDEAEVVTGTRRGAWGGEMPNGIYYVVCNGCGATGPDVGKERLEAVKLWEMRDG